MNSNESLYQQIQAQVDQLQLPEVIWYAAPFMFTFVLLEAYFSRNSDKKVYGKKDLVASTMIGLGNLVATAIIKSALFVTVFFFWLVSPFRISPSWWTLLPCMIAIDFARYWAHRIAHENRFFWATHVTHHSSEFYNLSVSFRLSWVQFLKFFFFLPVVMMGFDPFIFFVAHQIEVLYQFWIHTEMIKKLPAPIEYIFVTPSHHRVHHGKNDKYIDKNYGSTLIIWDRMFGTFQPEEETPDYGITKPVKSFNPVVLVFHEFVDISKDVAKAKGLKNKVKVIMGRP